MEFKIYLAGPISGESFVSATDWRNYIKEKLPKNIFAISPLRGKQRTEVYKSEVIKDTYEDNPLTSEKGIMMRDFNDVKRADLILVNLFNASKVSIGTVMEIAWAKAFNIPVILIMEKEGNLHNHAMLKNACGMIVEDIDQALELAISVLLPDIPLEYYLKYGN